MAPCLVRQGTLQCIKVRFLLKPECRLILQYSHDLNHSRDLLLPCHYQKSNCSDKRHKFGWGSPGRGVEFNMCSTHLEQAQQCKSFSQPLPNQ